MSQTVRVPLFYRDPTTKVEVYVSLDQLRDVPDTARAVIREELERAADVLLHAENLAAVLGHDVGLVAHLRQQLETLVLESLPLEERVLRAAR